jgi:cell division protease FtsH
VNYPDMKGREAILGVHARNKPLEGDVDLARIAKTTVGFTGADLANLMNEAALIAARRGKSLIGMEDVEDAFLRVVLGPQKKSKERRAADIKLTAYHEAGHAVVAYYSKHSDPVTHITIIPSGMAGGVTVYAPTEDRMGETKGQMVDGITSALGGRAAEQLVLDDISTGASGDIQQATRIARSMVMRYGMSDRLGTVLYGSDHSDAEVFLGRDFGTSKNYSENTASIIDEEIKSLIDNGYATALSILRAHMDKLVFVAEYLIKHESMDGDQFARAMQEGATEEDVLALAREKKEKSAEENKTAAAELKKKEEEEKVEAQTAEAVSDDTPSDDPPPSGDDIFRF